MFLKKLTKNPRLKKNIWIKGLSTNSKKIKKGYIFFAIKGFKLNGEKYINDAIKRGATVIVCSKKSKYENKDLPVIKVNNVRNFLSKISSKFFKLKPKRIIAVTGTNGKTSVADLFYQILSLNKIPVASIGTLGTKYKNKIIKSDLTSPDTISLHKTLEKIKRKNIDNVIIETSSHGLHQSRIDHIKLSAAIFTNFSQDHLDYHKTLKSYLNAKLILLRKILPKNRAIIYDKSIKQHSLIGKIAKRRLLKLKDISKIKSKLDDSTFPQLNNFQKKNLSMAIIAAKICNLEEKKIFNSINKLKEVNGRLEHVRTFSNKVKVFVDFAHTPDALFKSLTELKNLHRKNISVVFGCGGNRDFKKRPLMAKIASDVCKNIYITDDNPRDETPHKIRNEIQKNVRNKNCFNIGDRALAIKTAIKNALPEELILIAGKGHEDKQIYKNKILKFSDKKIIKNLKIKLGIVTNRKLNFIENKKILFYLTKVKKSENFHGLAIDSRIIKKQNIFLTLKGKNNDGIKFIPYVIKKGINYIISSKKNKKYERKIIRVKDEIKFLNNFAFLKRKFTNAKILAITGSAGKTSLKNLIRDLLQNYGKTFCSPKSYNNHFGVPISLSQLTTYDKYGVFEVGMSKPGEINNLSKLVRPHIGFITNIGEAHIENFENLKGVAEAKSELINNIEKNGTIILNYDDKFFNFFKKKAKLNKLKIVSFGKNKNADVHLISFTKKNNIQKLKIKLRKKIIKLEIKDINIYNVLSSLALLDTLNLDINKVIKNFKNYEPSEGRGKIYKIKRYKKNFKLIDESYNANPLSVRIAIKNFNLIKKNKFKKYLLLGDMLELGKKSDQLHKNLSKVINNSDIDKVFIKGQKTLSTYKNINIKKRGNIFQQDEDIDFTLNNIIANNDYLMIKGSNATGLNNYSKRIIKG